MRALLLLSTILAASNAAPQFVFVLPQDFAKMPQESALTGIKPLQVSLPSTAEAVDPTPEQEVPPAEGEATPVEEVELVADVDEMAASADVNAEAGGVDLNANSEVADTNVEATPEIVASGDTVNSDVAVAEAETNVETAATDSETYPEVVTAEDTSVNKNVDVVAQEVSTPIQEEVPITDAEISEITEPVEKIASTAEVIPVVEDIQQETPVAQNEISTQVGAEPAAKIDEIPPTKASIAKGKSLSSGTQLVNTGALSKIIPAPVVNQVDPLAHVDPRYRSFIYPNDAPDVVAAKIALFRVHAERIPVRKTITV